MAEKGWLNLGVFWVVCVGVLRGGEAKPVRCVAGLNANGKQGNVRCIMPRSFGERVVCIRRCLEAEHLEERVMRSVSKITLGLWVVGVSVLGWAEGSAGKDVAAVSQGDADLEAIKIELPEAFAGGTPCSYWSVQLEEEDFRERPPYLAPKGTAVVSAGKPVSSSTKDPFVGELKLITDGDKDHAKTSLVELKSGVQWVQIDLEKAHKIYAILFWHFHQAKEVYFDIVVRLSDDPDFEEGVSTVYNNDYDNSAGLGVGKDMEYIESNKGRLVKLPEGPAARYVRLYSNGNSASEMNHYVEVEVFGKAVGG